MINHVVGTLVVGEGLVCGVAAYVLFRKKRAKLAVCQRTRGEVLAVNERRGGDGTTRHPIIRYRTLTGEERTFESRFGSSNWKVRPGDQLEVLFHPNDPAQAEVVHFMAQWGLPLICGIISVGSLMSAPVVYMVLKTS
jgi:hypothetical protein